MRLHFILSICALGIGLSSSCNMDVDLTCRSGSFTDVYQKTSLTEEIFEGSPATSFAEDVIHFRYSQSGKIEFTLGKTIDNICPGVPLQVTYQILTTNLEQSRQLIIQPVVSYSVQNQNGFTGHSIFFSLTPNIISPSTTYTNSVMVDLESLFQKNEATMDVYFNFLLDPSNTFSEDSLYLINHIQSIQITTKGDYYL